MIHKQRPGLLWKLSLAQLPCLGVWIFTMFMDQSMPHTVHLPPGQERLLLPYLMVFSYKETFLSPVQTLSITGQFAGTTH